MDYIEIQPNQEIIFYHMTLKQKIDSILTQGIIAYEGQEGIGVYCVEEQDYDDLIDGLLELFSHRGHNINDLVIVKFKYDKIYYKVPIDNLIYQNEGWVVIKENVSVDNIIGMEGVN